MGAYRTSGRACFSFHDGRQPSELVSGHISPSSRDLSGEEFIAGSRSCCCSRAGSRSLSGVSKVLPGGSLDARRNRTTRRSLFEP